MMERVRYFILVVVVLLLGASLGGCLKPTDMGPFRLESYDVIVDDYNLTVFLSFRNRGEQTVRPYDFSLNADLTYRNGTLKDSSTGGGTVDYPGSFLHPERRDSLFNRSDRISGGAWRNLTVHVSYPAADNDVDPSDLYRPHLNAEYFVGEGGPREHAWTFTLTCYTIKSLRVEEPDCERLFVYQ